MTEIGVSEAARWLHVSPQRVRALIATGALPARRVSGVWLIDSSRPWQTGHLSRPLSPSAAQALIDALSGEPRTSLSPSQRARVSTYLNRLRDHPDPGRLLRGWLARRPNATLVRLSANPADLPDIATDLDFVPSGVSDFRSGLGAGADIEGWVASDCLEALADRYLLTPGGRGNVLIRTSLAPMPRPVSFGVLLADLAAWPTPREQEAVRRLLADRQWPGG